MTLPWSVTVAIARAERGWRNGSGATARSRSPSFQDAALYDPDGGFFSDRRRGRTGGTRLRHEPRGRVALRRCSSPGTLDATWHTPRLAGPLRRRRGRCRTRAPRGRRPARGARLRAGAALRAGRAVRGPAASNETLLDARARRRGARSGRPQRRRPAMTQTSVVAGTWARSSRVSTSCPCVTFDGVVLANELLDNLPVRIVERPRRRLGRGPGRPRRASSSSRRSSRPTRPRGRRRRRGGQLPTSRRGPAPGARRRRGLVGGRVDVPAPRRGDPLRLRCVGVDELVARGSAGVAADLPRPRAGSDAARRRREPRTSPVTSHSSTCRRGAAGGLPRRRARSTQADWLRAPRHRRARRGRPGRRGGSGRTSATSRRSPGRSRVGEADGARRSGRARRPSGHRTRACREVASLAVPESTGSSSSR